MDIPESTSKIIYEFKKQKDKYNKDLVKKGLPPHESSCSQEREHAIFLFSWFIDLKGSEEGAILFDVISEPDEHHCFKLADIDRNRLYFKQEGFVFGRLSCGGETETIYRTVPELAKLDLNLLRAACNLIITGEIWSNLELKLKELKQKRYIIPSKNRK